MTIRKNLILPVAAAVCFLVPATAVFAQQADPTATTSTKKVKAPKTIKFTVANQTKTPVSLTAGAQQLTIAPGASQNLTAPSGTKLVTSSDSSLGASGTVVAEVTDTMNGSTVNVR
jgi:hypothetical protein